MNIIDATVRTEATRKNVKLAIPVLVHWAKTAQHNHPYIDLIHALGYKNWSGIGRVLYYVQKALNALMEQEHCDIPTLNSLCKNKEMLPSDGFEYVSPHYNDLNKEGKDAFTKGLDKAATEYQNWDWVLAKLGLQETNPLTKEQLEAIRNFNLSFGGGEGPEHKALKEFILNHPEAIGIKNVKVAETEHPLPSGDRLDVFFMTKDGTNIAVEVKPATAPELDISRGIFQCVKYSAVMNALKSVEAKNYDVKSMLITPASLSNANKELVSILNVNYIDNFKTKPTMPHK